MMTSTATDSLPQGAGESNSQIPYWAIFLLIIVPAYPIIKLPGAMPDFSITRLIIIALVFRWMSWKKVRTVGEAPFFRHIILLGLMTLMSVMTSVYWSVSFKDFLSLTFQVYFFYFMLATMVSTREEALKILRYVIAAILVLAVLTVLEYYTKWNPVDAFFPGFERKFSLRRYVIATYPHRILLGYAFAMVLPLFLTLHKDVAERLSRRKAVLVCLMLVCCYFSLSRGPWLAVVVASSALVLTGSKRIRGRLALIGIAGSIVLFLRPGVYETLEGAYEATYMESHVKSSSYQYRWELWRKAYEEVSRSPVRMGLGYGPGTSQELNLAGWLSYNEHESEFWSWDNYYAERLLETGFLGLAALAFLYYTVVWRLFRGWWRMPRGPDRDMVLGLITGLGVFLFAMSNVSIFAPQLFFLFWCLAVVAMTLIRTAREGEGIESSAAGPDPPKRRNERSSLAA